MKWREYRGSNYLRQRLVLASLTSTSVRIMDIRWVLCTVLCCPTDSMARCCTGL